VTDPRADGPTRPSAGGARRGGATASAAEAPPANVVVIVLNWNAEADTAACLDSFLVQDGVDATILLVDNASPDGSGDRLRARYPAVSYLQTGANLGYAGGNNRGIEWARARGADWIVVVNNDTLADRECLRRLLAAGQTDPRIAALAPLVVRADEPDRVWFAGGHHARVRATGVHAHFGARVRDVTDQLERGAPDRWESCSFLNGCCLLLRRDALDEVGPFRADFFAYAEDLELSIRLVRAGWRLGWVPSARLAHRVPPATAEASPIQLMLRDRNRRRLVRAHYSLGWRMLFSLWFWPTRLVHLARYAMRGDAPRAMAIVAGMSER
jgi:GT2 family glycosyltransferase